MKITVDTEKVGVSLLAADDYSWTWDATVDKFRHEDGVTLATLEEIVAKGSPVSLVIDDISEEL